MLTASSLEKTITDHSPRFHDIETTTVDAIPRYLTNPPDDFRGTLRERILHMLKKQNFDWGEYKPKEQLVLQDQNRKLGATSSKVLLLRGNAHEFKADKLAWFGGVCLIYTGEWNKIKNGTMHFRNEEQFELWLRSWYPRVDQVHDTIGVPSNACKQLFYVVEDSIWARRIAQYTGLDAHDLSAILRNVHEGQGRPVISRWLRRFGYKGNSEVIYSSDIESALDICIRQYERARGKRVKLADKDDTKVALMGSTSILFDITGVESGAFAIPIRYFVDMLEGHSFPARGLFHIGYLPYWGSDGPTRLQPNSGVAHRGNYKTIPIQEDLHLHGLNHFFDAKKPTVFSLAEIKGYVRNEIQALYEPQNELVLTSAA